MSDLISWKKTKMNGWNRYEGSTDRFGPYIIEKEDTRSYSIWWGGADIGEATNVTSAKHVAQNHANALAFGAHNQEPKV